MILNISVFILSCYDGYAGLKMNKYLQNLYLK